MRPGQSNKRVRGRSRRGPSPLSRSYESNGPDVKIRGTASHIAEKYMQLARDAQSAGDHVAAENYFQHAEHYFRIIAAAQAQSQQQNPNEQQRPRYNGDDSDMEVSPGGSQQRSEPHRGDGPQPPYRPQANGAPQPMIDQPRPASEAASNDDESADGEQSAEHTPAERAPEQAKSAPEAAGEEAAEQANGAAAPAPKRRRRRATPSAEASPKDKPAAKSSNGTAEHDAPAEMLSEVPSESDTDTEDKLVAAGDS